MPEIVPLSRNHDRSGFDCGDKDLNAFLKTVTIAEQAGIIGLCVDANNTNARTFYERYGFILLPNGPLRLYLPLASLRNALSR